MHNNLEYISIMRYNKKRKYRIFGDGCNSLPAVIVTDYLAGWWVIELEQFSNMLQVIETAYIAIDKSEHKPASHWHDSLLIRPTALPNQMLQALIVMRWRVKEQRNRTYKTTKILLYWEKIERIVKVLSKILSKIKKKYGRKAIFVRK